MQRPGAQVSLEGQGGRKETTVVGIEGEKGASSSEPKRGLPLLSPDLHLETTLLWLQSAASGKLALGHLEDKGKLHR